jgi:hypothetical protein
MSPIEKKKFEEEFIYDFILYIDYPEIEVKEENKITLEEFKEK